jgi:hypothetical protein
VRDICPTERRASTSQGQAPEAGAGPPRWRARAGTADEAPQIIFVVFKQVVVVFFEILFVSIFVVCIQR